MSDTTDAGLRALEALDAVTTTPPAANTEPELVLSSGEEVMARREQALHRLTEVLERDPQALRGLAEAGLLRGSIEERTAAWHAAIVRARHLVGERMQAVSRLRQLARR
jgi:hypothetical protein